MFGFLKSVFTPAGTNASNSQNDRNRRVAVGGEEIFNAFKPLVLNGANALQNQFDYAKSLEPRRQNVINQGIGQLATGLNMDYSGQARKVGNQAREAGFDIARSFGNTNPSLSTGLNLAAQNRGATATGQEFARLNDPQYQLQQRQQIMQAMLGLFGQSANSPQAAALMQALNAAAQGGSLVYGQPQVQVQGSPLGSLLQMAGNFYGAQK